MQAELEYLNEIRFKLKGSFVPSNFIFQLILILEDSQNLMDKDLSSLSYSGPAPSRKPNHMASSSQLFYNCILNCVKTICF